MISFPPRTKDTYLRALFYKNLSVFIFIFLIFLIFFISDLVNIQNALLPGKERFPEKIEVQFSHYGNDIRLLLTRDDETTQMLTEDVFRTSKFLPDNIFQDENSDVKNYRC